jgi:RNA polymerase sigma-70 factor (ECF subfamily)
MDASTDPTEVGLFEARYLAFLETVSNLRPQLHQYCSRMVGSVLDGEDVVQDALFQAYRKLESFDDSRPLKPWLFRIAHNQCIDFLRRRQVRQDAEAEVVVPDAVAPKDPLGPGIERAIERLVLTLPPKERASVLLKDVLDYSLEEIAELVDSTVGGVKAALNRGRAKLASLPELSKRSRQVPNPEAEQLLGLYVERFNRNDWDGLRELITDDARVRVGDKYFGPLTGSPYFGRYQRLTTPWRVAVGEVDGEPAVIVLEPGPGGWVPLALVRVELSEGRIVGITDYTHCPWVLSSAESVRFAA